MKCCKDYERYAAISSQSDSLDSPNRRFWTDWRASSEQQHSPHGFSSPEICAGKTVNVMLRGRVTTVRIGAGRGRHQTGFSAVRQYESSSLVRTSIWLIEATQKVL
ncbi:hypothetical protein CPLU01_07322 [Colletotrichum plurivorum]|uniref:Uncharacterized protein n=1 Tax=Colletotrichum plurivorum TaxID=2175906 RepID=A0A8H6NF34_9PEZI|nr:hypothetical protein CPLU01_07322 [Colletotrichum plurivorum]